MCPEAKIDDGLLDVTYVQNVAPEKVPELLQVVAMGGKETDELTESIKTMRVPWLEVSSLINSLFLLISYAWMSFMTYAQHAPRTTGLRDCLGFALATYHLRQHDF